MIGKSAVRAAVGGKSGMMMAYVRQEGAYAVRAEAMAVSEIANRVKAVPDAFINEKGTDITDEGLAYIAPLIAGELRTQFKDGLPVHLILK